MTTPPTSSAHPVPAVLLELNNSVVNKRLQLHHRRSSSFIEHPRTHINPSPPPPLLSPGRSCVAAPMSITLVSCPHPPPPPGGCSVLGHNRQPCISFLTCINAHAEPSHNHLLVVIDRAVYEACLLTLLPCSLCLCLFCFLTKRFLCKIFLLQRAFVQSTFRSSLTCTKCLAGRIGRNAEPHLALNIVAANSQLRSQHQRNPDSSPLSIVGLSLPCSINAKARCSMAQGVFTQD